MDGARETSRPAAAMKTERPSLRQRTWSPSLELLASPRFWRQGRRRLADDGVSMKHINCVFVKGGGSFRGSCGISATNGGKRVCILAVHVSEPAHVTERDEAGCGSSRRIWEMGFRAAGPQLYICYIIFFSSAFLSLRRAK